MDVVVGSDVPVGAGLSSSAALECAVGAAASDLFDLQLLDSEAGRARLAAACLSAESVVAGALTGGMDQSAALLCRAGHALLLDCRDGATEHIPVGLASDGAGYALLVVDTRAAHALNDGQYAARRHDCEQAAALLGVRSLRELRELQRHRDPGGAVAAPLPPRLARRTRHVVTEIDRVRAMVAALQEHDVHRVGAIMDASHASLRDDFEVSCRELDLAVQAAREAGALGARMTGGGFGGRASPWCLPTGPTRSPGMSSKPLRHNSSPSRTASQ